MKALCCGLAFGLSLGLLSAMRAPSVTFESEYARLLKSYGSYKSYGNNLSVADIEKRLSGDRRNTIRGIVHASFIDLNPGGPLVTWIDEVRSIWGVRIGSTEGKFQFRVSVFMKPGIRNALEMSGVFNGAAGPHVLLPQKKGGDDDPAFKDFKSGKNPQTWRQEADKPPRLQMSLLKDDERSGEIDVDFHGFFDGCHLVPANSDIGSGSGSTHSHLALLNSAFPFPPDLATDCHNSASHCSDSYAAPYCK